MTEIDAVLRDLEAGLFVQTQTIPAPAKHAASDLAFSPGLLIMAVDWRRIEPRRALIGRNYVSFAA